MAAIPWGMESWRKALVFEKTSTAKRGCAPCASAMRLEGPPSTQKTMSSAETLAFIEPIGRLGFELTRFHRGHTLARAKTEAKEMAMKWKTPVIIEIAVGLEINAYACAEVK